MLTLFEQRASAHARRLGFHVLPVPHIYRDGGKWVRRRSGKDELDEPALAFVLELSRGLASAREGS